MDSKSCSMDKYYQNILCQYYRCRYIFVSAPELSLVAYLKHHPCVGGGGPSNSYTILFVWEAAFGFAKQLPFHSSHVWIEGQSGAKTATNERLMKTKTIELSDLRALSSLEAMCMSFPHLIPKD